MQDTMPLVLLLAGWALMLGPLTAHGIREDEALYASWMLNMTQGNPLLVGVPLDKPPLYLLLLSAWHALAGGSLPGLRLLNCSITILNVTLLAVLARRLLGRRATWLAMALFAASPMTILFAPTLYTDPLLVFCFLAACLAAKGRRWGLLGLSLGLAVATKQQAVILLPLPLALAGIAGMPRPRELGRLAGGAGIALLLLASWDAARLAQTAPGGPPDLWTQSAVSYGGIGLAAAATWPRRGLLWLQQAQYLTGFAPLSVLLVGSLMAAWLPAGRFASQQPQPHDGPVHGRKRRGLRRNCILLRHLNVERARLRAGQYATARGAICLRKRRGANSSDEQGRMNYPALSKATACFVLAYLLLHTVLNFQVWDRYLLPLAPLAALLMAAGMLRLARTWGPGLILVGLLCLVPPAVTAASSGYPVGSDHGAYDGLDTVALYLRQNLPDDSHGVLYHHWLGWHWDYFLAGSHFQRVYYPNPDFLAADAAGPAGYERLIVIPAWHDEQPLRAALAARGLLLDPRLQTRRADGSVSFRVYAITAQNNADRP